jgi:hypothetical protein
MDASARSPQDCTYYFVPGMMYPYWAVTADNAHNLDADTDMGDLSPLEFTEWFLPRAQRITQEAAFARQCDDGGDA